MFKKISSKHIIILLFMIVSACIPVLKPGVVVIENAKVCKMKYTLGKSSEIAYLIKETAKIDTNCISVPLEDIKSLESIMNNASVTKHIQQKLAFDNLAIVAQINGQKHALVIWEKNEFITDLTSFRNYNVDTEDLKRLQEFVSKYSNI